MHQDQRSLAALTLLATGDVGVRGRMPWSSNQTFLAEVRHGDDAMLAVYKPGPGERPLWDFPRGLYRREAAAWQLSELLGWRVVPETIVRSGPLGEGSLQRFVEADFEQHHFTLVEDPQHHGALRTICAFDLLVNNTDRKSGHCLLDRHGHIWAVDNGLCFHPEPKLRTVIWEFAGEPIPQALVEDVARAVDQLPGALAEHLDAEEIDGVRRRCRMLLDRPVFPAPDPRGHCWPWPLV